MTEYTHTALKVSTKEQLDFLSEVSGLSRAKILEMVLGNIFEVASSFETLYFDFETSISRNAIYIYLGGKSKLVSGKTRTVIPQLEGEFLAKEMLKEGAKNE